MSRHAPTELRWAAIKKNLNVMGCNRTYGYTEADITQNKPGKHDPLAALNTCNHL
jgi:hypothetical protein